MLVKSLIWWLYVENYCKLLLTKICWWCFLHVGDIPIGHQHHNIGYQLDILMPSHWCRWCDVSLKSQICHQHIWSSTSVTNIVVTKTTADCNWRWYSWRIWFIQYESCIEYLFNVHLADVWPLDAQLNAHKCSLIGFAWLNQTSWLRPDSKFIYKGRRALTQQKINEVRLHQYQKCDISKKNYGFQKKLYFYQQI